MKVLELVKQLSIIDLLILVLDEKGFTDTEIISMTEVSKQTIHNAKKRNTDLLEALKMVKSPPAEYGNKDINIIVDAFSKAFGTTKHTKYDRFAAKRLGDKYGAKTIVGAMHALSLNQEDRYCPVVNNVSQFETKLPQIIKYLNGKSNEGIIEL